MYTYIYGYATAVYYSAKVNSRSGVEIKIGDGSEMKKGCRCIGGFRKIG